MSNPRVRQVIQSFKAHFQSENMNVPLALRQESPDVVFTALLEDDANPVSPLMPTFGLDASQATPEALGGEDPMAMLDELMGASVQGVGAGAPAGVPGPAGLPGGSGGAMPDISELMGMM